MMKNLFKKKGEVETITNYIVEHPTQNVITSQDIQNEMSNKLNYILNSNNIQYVEKEIDTFKESNASILNKAEKLKMLGFSNTPSSKIAEKIENTIKEKQKSIFLEKEEIELTKEFSLKFPYYKFVPDRIFEEVREKYNLYTASPKRYIKEIPDKNLQEIENFIPLIKGGYEVVERNFRWTLEMSRWGVIGDGEKVIMSFDTYEEAVANAPIRDRDLEYTVREKEKFQITAPLSHFDLEKTEIQNREIKDKIEIKDPIVSHKVNGGYIIVSVWDEEANIPEINNREFLN